MRNFFLIPALVITMFLFSQTLIFADSITIVADEWCPYGCAPDADKPGYGIEIAKKIFERAGHKIDYSIVPWARAVKLAREGKYNAIIGAFVEDAPDFVFPENEFGISQITFFVKKGSSWKYTGVESLKPLKIGIILDYSYGDELDKYFKSENAKSKIDILGGKTPLDSNIKKLVGGRIDVTIEDMNVFNHTAKKLGMLDRVTIAGNAGKENVYIAFSPAIPNSKQYAEILSNGISQMRNSGELQTILSKYGLADWK